MNSRYSGNRPGQNTYCGTCWNNQPIQRDITFDIAAIARPLVIVNTPVFALPGSGVKLMLRLQFSPTLRDTEAPQLLIPLMGTAANGEATLILLRKSVSVPVFETSITPFALFPWIAERLSAEALTVDSRIKLFPVSATYKFPDWSSATLPGADTVAAFEAHPSPGTSVAVEQTVGAPPITVVMIPDESTLRTRCCRYLRYRFPPAGSTAT